MFSAYSVLTQLTLLLNVAFPKIFKSFPTFKLFLIPTPPSVIKEPVVISNDSSSPVKIKSSRTIKSEN